MGGKWGGDATSSSLHRPLHSHTDYFAYYTPKFCLIYTYNVLHCLLYLLCIYYVLFQFKTQLVYDQQCPLPTLNHCAVYASDLCQAWKHTEPHPRSLSAHNAYTHRVHAQPKSQVMQSAAERRKLNRKRAGWEPHCCCHFRLLLSGQKAPAAAHNGPINPPLSLFENARNSRNGYLWVVHVRKRVIFPPIKV